MQRKNRTLTSLVGIFLLSLTCLALRSSQIYGEGSRALLYQPREEATEEIGARNLPSSCGDGFCRCYWYKNNSYLDADCSGHHGNLTYVPKLPENTTFLNFSYNSLKIIPDYFFLNVTDLIILDLSGTNVSVIESRAFGNLTRLREVFLNYNFNLSYSQLPPVFAITNLTSFALRQGRLKAIPGGFFRKFSLPYLAFLNLDDNRLGDIHLNEFTGLNKLSHLALAHNEVSKVYSAPLPRLVVLDLETNGIFYFPRTCESRTGNASLFPRLETLVLKQNLISYFPKQICLPELSTLDLSENLFTIIWSDMFVQFPSLLYLYLESMATKLEQIKEHAFTSPSLRNISLMYNYIEFGEDVVHNLSFSGCSNVTYLQLSHNYFNRMSDEKFRRLFGNLTHLKELYLGNAMIDHISRNAFANFTSIQILHLYDNQLSDLPDGAFDTMTSLQTLVLNSNRLPVVRETTFSPETRRRLRRLDIADNPFMCSCDLIWFQEWYSSSPKLFRPYQGNYTCGDPHGLPLSSFYLNDQACLMSSDTYVMIAVVTAMVIAALTVVVVLFRYRWHFRLLLYEAFRAGSNRRRQRFLSRGFRYDVFVSHADEDLAWVSGQLLPRLEGGMGLRLCLHQRDFIPGRNIVDNIASSVESSKKMVMVFSEHFARSQWCQFELALCLQHVMDHDDDLLVVYLDGVSSRHLTAAMLAVLKTTTYIQWGSESDAQVSFWGRLRVALREIAPRENHDLEH